MVEIVNLYVIILLKIVIVASFFLFRKVMRIHLYCTVKLYFENLVYILKTKVTYIKWAKFNTRCVKYPL